MKPRQAEPRWWLALVAGVGGRYNVWFAELAVMPGYIVLSALKPFRLR